MNEYSVLLVDDDPLILTSVGLNLEQEGFVVSPAEGGETAVELLGGNSYDVVITDLMMDRIDGLEVLKFVKKINPETVVIILTGYGNLNSAISALRLEADDYLLKPCDTQKLLFRTKKCLDNMEIKKKNAFLQEQIQKRNKDLEQEIDQRKKIEERLKQARAGLEEEVQQRMQELVTAKQELEKKTIVLERVNTALQVLIDKREEDKVNLEENIVLNVKKLIFPLIDKLKNDLDEERHLTVLDVLTSNLNSIISSFAAKLTSQSLNLTPAELQIANLIREGRTTKEIARLKNLSRRTVESHRDNIRKKMGLNRSKTNLRTYLLSLE